MRSDGKWSDQAWAVWNAERDAGATSAAAVAATTDTPGASSSGGSGGGNATSAPAVTVVLEPTMGVEEVAPAYTAPPAEQTSVSNTLLDILILVWNDTRGFRDLGCGESDHWANVALSLLQHGFNASHNSPASHSEIPYGDPAWMVWHDRAR